MAENRIEQTLERYIFASRWLQVPLYIGLIIGTILYTFKFCQELYHLTFDVLTTGEATMMVSLLTLVDMVMIANLVIMVIIGGYYTFVSKIDIESDDKLSWLDTVNAGILKIKLASSLIGVSAIHLLKTFIIIDTLEDRVVIFKLCIHMMFIISAIALALVEKMTPHEAPPQ